MLLETPRSWLPGRPGDPKGPSSHLGDLFGSPGPDQGYALKLAKRFEDRVQLLPGESAQDALSGCVAVATRRASLFGRAPVAADVEHALTLWGFLGTAPDDLVNYRNSLFRGAAHSYAQQRAIAGLVLEDTLKMPRDQLIGALGNWRRLLGGSERAGATQSGDSSQEVQPA